MTETHERDYRRRIEVISSSFLPGTSIEVICDGLPPVKILQSTFLTSKTLRCTAFAWMLIVVQRSAFLS